MNSEFDDQQRMTRHWQREARMGPRIIKGYVTDQMGRMSGAKLDRKELDALFEELGLALHNAITRLPKPDHYLECVYHRLEQARKDLRSMRRQRREPDGPTLPIDGEAPDV